jgi:hypothetical protein
MWPALARTDRFRHRPRERFRCDLRIVNTRDGTRCSMREYLPAL